MLVRNENGHTPQSEHNEAVPVSSQNTVGAAQAVSAGATYPSEVGISDTSSRPTAVNEEPVAVPGVNGVQCSIRVEAGQPVTGEASAFASPTSIPTVAMNPASITNASASRPDQHYRELDLQPQCSERKIDDLLGKLTQEDLEPISAQILAIANESHQGKGRPYYASGHPADLRPARERTVRRQDIRRPVSEALARCQSGCQGLRYGHLRWETPEWRFALPEVFAQPMSKRIRNGSNSASGCCDGDDTRWPQRGTSGRRGHRTRRQTKTFPFGRVHRRTLQLGNHLDQSDSQLGCHAAQQRHYTHPVGRGNALYVAASHRRQAREAPENGRAGAVIHATNEGLDEERTHYATHQADDSCKYLSLLLRTSCSSSASQGIIELQSRGWQMPAPKRKRERPALEQHIKLACPQVEFVRGRGR